MPRLSWIALLLIFVPVSALYAQPANGSLEGRVTGPLNAVVVGADVVAVNAATNISYETKTDAEGEYYLLNLPSGLYRIQIEKSGFEKLIKTGPCRASATVTAGLKCPPEIGPNVSKVRPALLQ